MNADALPTEVSEAELSAEHLRDLLDRNPLAIAFVDPEDRVRYCNEAFERLFGYAAAEIRDRDIKELVARDVGDGAEACSRRVHGGQIVDVRGTRRRKDGSPIEVAIRGIPVRVDGRPAGAFAVYEDLEPRRKAERERDLLAALVEESAATIVVTGTTDRRVRYLNPAARRAFGVPPETTELGDLLDYHPDSERGLILDEILPRIRADKAWEGEITGRSRGGDTLRFRGRAFPIRPAEGAHGDAFAMVMEDVSRLRALEQEVGRVRRLEALGRLAGGVAHDFNNLLTGITGYANFLRDDLADDADALEDVDQILDAARRAEHLVQQLLSFSRRKVADTAVYDANSAVRELQEILDRLLPGEVCLEIDVPSEPAWLQGDRPQLESAVINLVLNARDALSEGGAVRIRSLAPSADRVTIEVEDDGIGMTDQVLRQACEPFFSTKERSEDSGRGLGLASVYGFVSASGGRFELRSSPGAGTTARMELPTAGGSDAEPTADEEDTSPSDPIPTVLVVDDEAMVRRLVVRSLADEGYEVLEARGPAEALELCAQREEGIHLLVTDVIMPGMSGVELAEKIAASQPDLRTLYISGYAEDVAPSRTGKLGATDFLPKPFSAAEIREHVARQLARQTS